MGPIPLVPLPKYLLATSGRSFTANATFDASVLYQRPGEMEKTIKLPLSSSEISPSGSVEPVEVDIAPLADELEEEGV
jgi:hypothetical protein